jgi:hypothetical protein
VKSIEHYETQAAIALDLLELAINKVREDVHHRAGRLESSLGKDAPMITALATAAHTFLYAVEERKAELVFQPLGRLFADQDHQPAEEEPEEEKEPYVLAFHGEGSYFVAVRSTAPDTRFAPYESVEGIRLKTAYNDRMEIQSVLNLANATYWHRQTTNRLLVAPFEERPQNDGQEQDPTELIPLRTTPPATGWPEARGWRSE